ncbi:npp-15, partial [Pristionchus pacificus]|uniref:Npp-15 n=1 Tax=Pristionchus pacificus TaxID=54126 RepID=A0A2A6CZN8_PRIPA
EMEGLDLTLNKYSTHYPALVKEVLLSESSEGLSGRCASIANGWCWLISGSQIFVWKLVEGNRSAATSAYQMSLQRSGLPFTQDNVVIYSRGANVPPGLIVVSGEGTLRRWAPLGDTHLDTVIDIASEVVLSVQIDGTYYAGSLFVLLTTTSGSMFRIDLQEKNRELTVTSTGSIVSRGLKSRISTMLWGTPSTQANSTNSRILRIIVMNRPQEEVNEDDEEANTILLAVSTTMISLYSPFDKALLWTVPFQQLTLSLLPSKLRGANIRVGESNQLWCLDVIPLRQGALFLFGVGTMTGGVELGLAYLDLRNNISTSPAAFNSIFMLNNRPTVSIFRSFDESSFVGRVHLLMAGTTMRSKTMVHTDGVSVLHHKCIQTVFLPDSFHEKSVLRFSKINELHSNDTILGYASCSDYSFLIRAKAGIETIRVLPIGFDQESEESLKEIEDVLEEREGEPQFIAMFKKSLWYFVSKRMALAAETLNELLKIDNEHMDLPTTIHMYLQGMIDSTCSSSGISSDLRNKKLIYQRLILYLKNMNLFEQILVSDKTVIPPFMDSIEVWKMSACLQEVSERLDVALTLSTFTHPMEVRLLEEAAEYGSKNYGASEGGLHNAFLSKVSAMHILFPSLISSLRSHLTNHSCEYRIDALSATSRIMMAMSTAIQRNRASHTSISVPTTADQWTHGKIAQTYLDLAAAILSEMEKEGGGLSETSRMRLKEWLTLAIVFGLNEQRDRAENNSLLRRIYDMGEPQLALEMAERFKDFRLLMVITKSMEDDERRGLLDGYKRRFVDDNFELYMCNYYLKNNMMDNLLEQRGEKVEAFMEEHDSAAHSLITVAARETNTLWEQKMYASLAFLSAVCADESAEKNRLDKVKKCADETLILIGHQERIPLETISVMYPDQRVRTSPLTLDQLIGVNVFEFEDPNDRADGLFRALLMLGDLLSREKSRDVRNELKERISEIWKRTFDTAFYQIQSAEEANRTLFVAILTKLQDTDELGSETKISILPSSSLLKSSASDVCTNVVEQRVETTRMILVE